MRHDIVLAPEAVDDLRRLRAFERTAVRAALEQYYAPTQIGKSRIKRLRGLARPQYRLRVEDVRVFHDVAENVVEVLAIVAKADADDWLA